MVKILLPPHKIPSEPVEKLTDELKKDIEGMRFLLHLQKFDNNRQGMAIAHCQVSRKPVGLFVAQMGLLPHSLVINPYITEESEPYMVREMCLSYPNEKAVVVERFRKIKVHYEDEYGQEWDKELEGLQAQIFQHEIQHFEGDNIYNK